MPRLTAPFILSRPITYSPLLLREIDFRSSSIPSLENLLILRDQLDSYDFTDNDLPSLTNLPRLTRCKEINLSSNIIETLQSDISSRLPNLEILTLTSNSLKTIRSILPILSCTSLRYLSLLGNGVTGKKYYRMIIIGHLKNLKVLDYKKITSSEREKSSAFLKSSICTDLLSSLKSSSSTSETLEEVDSAPLVTAGTRSFTVDDKKLIKSMIEQAKSAEVIDVIQEYVKRGEMPPRSVMGEEEKEEEEKEQLIEEEKEEPTATATATAPAPASKKRPRSTSNASVTSDTSKGSGKRSRANSSASKDSKVSKKSKTSKTVETEEKTVTEENFAKLTVAKLKDLMKEKGIEIPKKAKKAELVKILEES
ncbi:hypothetical protein TrST_g6563 [Triparma strigata]|uniref:HeH/LEM domain-containing protein n=1 Tax=Triparma strigata TaxID=1606541 RepID=A0A9W7ARU8_9STRA|nr:hypothetical protein TrST_g6563 [Triparma strigata]